MHEQKSEARLPLVLLTGPLVAVDVVCAAIASMIHGCTLMLDEGCETNGIHQMSG